MINGILKLLQNNTPLTKPHDIIVRQRGSIYYRGRERNLEDNNVQPYLKTYKPDHEEPF